MKTLLELYQTAEADGITVDSFPFSAASSMSYMDDDGTCYIAIDHKNVVDSVDEKRKLSHEMGHCETGGFYNINSPADIKGRHEERADRWAIKMLIPKDELDEAVQNGITTPWDLAEYFDVTEPFLRKAVEYYKMLDNAG